MNKNLVVKQTDMQDCGACCIQSIIKFYNGYINLENLKMDTATSKTGTTAFNLVDTLKKYGFEAYGLKLKFTDLIQGDIVLPVIAHVTVFEKYLHFVVIYKIDSKKENITIMDPAYGFRTISFQEFKNIWNEFIIISYPINNIPNINNKNNNILKYYFKCLIKQKDILNKLILLQIIIIISSIAISFYFKLIINIINKYNNIKFLILFVLGYSFIYLYKIFSEYLKNHFENYLNKNLNVYILCPFIKHIMYLPSNYIKSKSSGEIITRISELNVIKDVLSKFFVNTIFDFLLAIISIIILFIINAKLGFILLIIGLLYLIISLVFKRPIYNMIVDNRELETTFNTKLIEYIEGLSSIKNLHYEKNINLKLEYSLIKYLKNSLNLKKIIDMQEVLKNFIMEMGLFFLISVSFYMYLKKSITILDLITFNSLTVYFTNPLKNLISFIPQLNFIKFSINKINDFYSFEEEKFIDSRKKIDGNIEFRNVSFSYNHYNNIFDNFNLRIVKGEKVMLKGKSGNGKSTICKLLCRFIEGQGEILINEENIKDINLNIIRNSIIYVSQKEKLFTDTIKNNICCGNESNELFNKICQLCHLEDIVSKNCLRYNSMIVDGGVNLSGGEKQRIILARGLMRGGNILVIDEALSEVDEKLEKEIIKNLLSFYKEKTIIYVSHKNLNKLFERTINV